MQVKNPTPHQYLGNAKTDIKLSLYEYYDMVDALLDDRLSASALMKFKELYRCNSMQLVILPTLSIPTAWVINRWFCGWVNRGMAQSRFNMLGMAMFYPLVVYMAATKVRVPRKLYTDVLADTGDDGEYIRQMIASRKPGLWNFITPQLERLGYNFKQMNNARSSTTEFPRVFFSATDL